MMTYSEIFRIQQIVDNLSTLIKIAEEGRKRELEGYEVQKCKNLVENSAEQFYMISEDIIDRQLCT